MSSPTTRTNPVGEEKFDRERAALNRLLAAGVFDRSPGLALFLRYVCERYFEGRSEGIKEYNIAVEALGRSPEFDQKRDAIVRVEAHRLRKRLQQFYETKGASEPVRIEIPSGSYAPVFRYQGVRVAEPERLVEAAYDTIPGVASEAPSELLDPAVKIAEPLAAESGNETRWPVYAVAALLLVAAGATGMHYARSNGAWSTGSAAAATPATREPVAALGPMDETRILAGSTAARYVDHLGNVWGPDRYFTGGTAVAVSTRPIGRTSDPQLYLNRRQGRFKYEIPLKPGSYELRLHFAETMFGDNNIAGGGETSRIFHVKVNGKFILTGWDALSDAFGSNTANIRVFRDVRPDSDGSLHLEFEPTLKEAAFVNGIEVIPSGPGGATNPVRIVARASAFTDSTQLEWLPDRFFTGGQPVQRFDEILGTADSILYQSERYGNFTYVIPVAEGSKYTANLRFSEHWFGPGRPGGGGAGSRLFDIYVNGRVLLEKFDVFKTAGGALKPVAKTFRGLQPNAQGKLMFQFVPVRNYALVNAIEIVEEAR